MMTVSRALNAETRDKVAPKTLKRILTLATELGYRPNIAARTIRSGRKPVVLLWMPTPESPLYAPYLGEFGASASSREIEVIYIPESIRDSVSPKISIPSGLDFDGIIAIDSPGPAAEARVQFPSVPVLELGGFLGDTKDKICYSFEECGRLSAEHLIDCGYQKLVVFEQAMTPELGRMNYVDGRMMGFVAASAEAGVQVERLAFSVLTQERVYSATRRLLQGRKSRVGVFCRNDALALAAIRAAADVGAKIPSELGVVGLGGRVASIWSAVTLTSVEIPYFGLTSAAIDWMSARILGHTELKPSELLPVQLLQGDSTG